MASRTPQEISADLQKLAAEVASLVLAPPAPSAVTVSQVSDLQPALNKGGEIIVAPGEYAGTFILRSNTKLTAVGAKFTGSALGPAFDVALGAHDIEISGFEANTGW